MSTFNEDKYLDITAYRDGGLEFDEPQKDLKYLINLYKMVDFLVYKEENEDEDDENE